MELEPGQDTATAVLELIQLNPDMHDQLDWVNWHDTCGTRRCVAGWTLHAHGYNDQEIMRLAAVDGVFDYALPPVAKKAAELLSIDEFDAYTLFYSVDNEEARTAVEWLAAGKALDWDEIVGADTKALVVEAWEDRQAIMPSVPRAIQ